MNSENNLFSQEKREPKKPDKSLSLLNRELTEAIELQDYEKAAVLRDLINEKKQNSPSESDVDNFPKQAELDSHIAIAEKIKNYKFYDRLISDSKIIGVLGFKGWNKIRKMQGIDSNEKTDLILDLMNDREEVNDIVKLAEEKLTEVNKTSNGSSDPSENPDYWQRIYNNSQIILNELDIALSTLRE